MSADAVGDAHDAWLVAKIDGKAAGAFERGPVEL